VRPALVALLAGVVLGTPAGSVTAEAAQCDALLDETLVAMEARAPMKDELATALMWIRLDAQEALEAGDAGACLGLARRAATLLQIAGHD
jgi:hypothetical protein